MNKHFLFIIGAPALLVLVIIVAGIYRLGVTPTEVSVIGDENVNRELVDPIDGYENGRVANPNTPSAPVQRGKLAADTFTGTLTKVDTACFADGECYIEVDGKHVTAITGWSQEIAGTVQGVPGFGDLESHIGEQVEVYAQRLSPGNYTLYGSEGFYIRLLNGSDEGVGQTTPGSAGAGVSGSMPPQQGIAIGEPNPSAPRPEPTGGCMIGGCSSQLCIDARDGGGMSTCEWRESYACYQTATCERQASGQCGWTETPALTQCLSQVE
jgi:hypothetical protein